MSALDRVLIIQRLPSMYIGPTGLLTIYTNIRNSGIHISSGSPKVKFLTVIKQASCIYLATVLFPGQIASLGEIVECCNVEQQIYNPPNYVHIYATLLQVTVFHGKYKDRSINISSTLMKFPNFR